MSNDFFAHKIRTLFSRFDMDQNGRIEHPDFANWAQKIISIGNLNESQQESLKTNIDLIWNTYFLPADFDNDGSVLEEELVSHMRESLTDKNKLKAIDVTLNLIFDAIDSNQDEGVSGDEFNTYFQSLGVFDAEFAAKVFEDMDSNHDGILSKKGKKISSKLFFKLKFNIYFFKEFGDFGQEFFLGTDESSPSKHFFGPLF